MTDFGRYLLEHRIVTSAQLEEATRCKVIFGVRLGTHLVELGRLEIDELERHLGDHLGVPAAPKAWLESPPAAVLEAVAVELVQRFGVLPLHAEKRELHVAMLDPTDPHALDDIGFATGRAIVPYAIAEARLDALVEHHYGIVRERRAIDLGDEGMRRRVSRPRAEAAEARPPVTEDLIDEESFTSLHGTWNGDGAATAVRIDDLEQIAALDVAADSGVAALEAALARAADRELVSELTLRIALRHADAAALFVVRGGVVSGFRGDGRAIPEKIDAILLPVESDSDIARPSHSRVAFRSDGPASGIDARVLASLGRSAVRDFVVLPVPIRGQVVNLLYADADGALGATSVAALGALAQLVADAYERLILQAKRERL